MKSMRFLAATALATATIFATTGTAWAQTPAADQAADEDEKEEDAKEGNIVVTGSRIARPTLESDVPLTSVSVEELTSTGDVSLGDALNDLPSLRSTFSAGNSTRFIGTAGLNILDLRGLGTARTLVLVNGRRHITSSPGDNDVDINTIPTDLLERVDIVTGGNSAVYGSDAVAGVVNFVLKRDFDGYAMKGQGGISSRGDRGSYFASFTAGKNFGDGRGNIAVSAEYARQEPLYFRDRDSLTGAYSGRCQFQQVDLQGAAGGEIGQSATDGIPDNEFLCGIRNNAISDGGTVGVLSTITGAALRFGTDGNLFVDTPTRAFGSVGSTGNVQGGNGSTLRNTGSLLAEVDRYTLNMLAHFDVSDAFRPFVEAKYVNVKATGEGQPSFFQGSLSGFFGGGSNLRCNNGFLTASSLTTLQGRNICTNVAAGTFNIARFNTDFGGRFFSVERQTTRVVAGIEGTFNDDWKYEVAANYGKFRSDGANQNNLYLFDENFNPDGFLLAADAIVAPATFTGTNFTTNAAGQRVICRVNGVTNARPDCIPVNIFGSGNIDPRAFPFIHRDGTNVEKAGQFVASTFVSGDLSQLFELPGGPISFALGGEYRTETASIIYDEISAADRTFFNAFQPFVSPKLKVKDAYAELRIPILKDSAIAKDLSVQLAGRVSDYNNSVGTVYAYNVQGTYAPISDIRFRAAYATSVRAPTQSDLFSPQAENFAFIADPCDTPNPGSIQATNCVTAGVPTVANAALVAACAGTANTVVIGQPWLNCTARAASTGFVSGGNPTLVEERGKSLTLGVVLEPRFIPGLNFTVDYYNIKVKQLIAALGAQQLITLCYGSATGINNPFCATVNRDPATGLFNEPAVISGGVNFAAQRTKGIDFDLAYRKTFDNGDKLRIRTIVTRAMALNNFTDPTNPLAPNRQLSELGDAKWMGNLNVGYNFGSFDVSYNARYIGKTTIGTYEAQNQYRGVCPVVGAFIGQTGINGGTCTPGDIVTLAPQNADQFPTKYYPSAIYHNLRLGAEVSSKFEFYAGVDNLFDKKPPFGLLGTVSGDNYDSFGRFFYVGVSAEF
jgi:outer membrane receptor protein involved in Fe transport